MGELGPGVELAAVLDGGTDGLVVGRTEFLREPRALRAAFFAPFVDGDLAGGACCGGDFAGVLGPGVFCAAAFDADWIFEQLLSTRREIGGEMELRFTGTEEI